jgi:hypothetical protein
MNHTSIREKVSVPCPRCNRFNCELQTGLGHRARIVCQTRGCGFHGPLGEIARALEEALANLPADAGTDESEPPPPPPVEAPRSFAPKPGETPRERQLAFQAANDRLRTFGLRVPEIPDMARALSDEEMARRASTTPVVSKEQKERDDRYHRLLKRAGISGAGIVTPEATQTRVYRS